MGVTFLAKGSDYCNQLLEDSNKICFISLNNTKEKEALEKRYSNNPEVSVVELVSHGENPFRSIKKNLEAIKACNVSPPCSQIVISGHQNGSFWGEIVSDDLSPGDLMLLSCQAPEIKMVNSVWLQGCNTIDEHSPEVPYDPQIFDADDQKFSLNAIQSEFIRNLSDSSIEVSLGHKANYDVTDGYANAFPSANLHGWQGIAPGVGSGSPQSVILHLQQSIEFLIENNINSMSVEEANRYLQARKQELEGKGLSQEINRDFNDDHFLEKIQKDLQRTLGQENFNCVWQIYQEKYFETSGEKKRRPRSAPSAKSRGISFNKELCDANNIFGDISASQNLLKNAIKNLLEAPGPMKQKLRAIESLIKYGNISELNKKFLKEFLSKDTNLNEFLKEEMKKEESLAVKLESYNIGATLTNNTNTTFRKKAQFEFNKKILQKEVRESVNKNMSSLLNKNLKNATEIDHSEEILDWLKLLEESVKGDFLSSQNWELIGANLSKFPEFAQQRIISLANKEHSSKIPQRLKRLVDGRVRVLESIDLGSKSLSEKKLKQNALSTNVLASVEDLLLKESESGSFRTAQPRVIDGAKVVRKQTDDLSPQRSKDVDDVSIPKITKKPGPKTKKPHCSKNNSYRFNPNQFKNCNAFRDPSDGAKRLGVNLRSFPNEYYLEVPICFKVSSLQKIRNTKEVFNLTLQGNSCIGSRSVCFGERCKTYRCYASPLYRELSPSYCNKIVDPNYCRLYKSCLWSED